MSAPDERSRTVAIGSDISYTLSFERLCGRAEANRTRVRAQGPRCSSRERERRDRLVAGAGRRRWLRKSTISLHAEPDRLDAASAWIRRRASTAGRSARPSGAARRPGSRGRTTPRAPRPALRRGARTRSSGSSIPIQRTRARAADGNDPSPVSRVATDRGRRATAPTLLTDPRLEARQRPPEELQRDVHVLAGTHLALGNRPRHGSMARSTSSSAASLTANATNSRDAFASRGALGSGRHGQTVVSDVGSGRPRGTGEPDRGRPAATTGSRGRARPRSRTRARGCATRRRGRSTRFPAPCPVRLRPGSPRQRESEIRHEDAARSRGHLPRAGLAHDARAVDRRLRHAEHVALRCVRCTRRSHRRTRRMRRGPR